MQAQCEAANPASFPSMFSCTQSAIMARNPGIMGDARAKLYMLRGEQLAAQVTAGKITDLDARVEWQRLFVELRQARDAEVFQMMAVMPKPAPTTTCTSTAVLGTVQTVCR
jgi:hypothetical protein